jgi:uncharacterized DUF497 family protein
VIFSWDEWNVQHIAKHGVIPAEAEDVVLNATNPFPRKMKDGKLLVWGQTAEGRYLQVIYVVREVADIDFGSVTLEQLAALSDGEESRAVYVVHAMTLSGKLLRQYRRTRR